jgi:phosphoglycolate phosphatase-like HAD superfamily hydrolase
LFQLGPSHLAEFLRFTTLQPLKTSKAKKDAAMTSGKFIRGVIFDLDGTLADTLPLCIAAFRAAIHPLAGRTLSDEEIIATFGPSEEGTIRALIPHRFGECLEDYLRHYESMHDAYSVPFDGIASLLDELRSARVPLAVVTGKGSRSAAISLKVLGLEHYFTPIKSGSPEGPCKDLAILDVLKEWGIAPGETVYVGDAPTDVLAARTAGCYVASACWASTAQATALEALQPDAVVRTVSELKDWLTPKLGTPL